MELITIGDKHLLSKRLGDAARSFHDRGGAGGVRKNQTGAINNQQSFAAINTHRNEPYDVWTKLLFSLYRNHCLGNSNIRHYFPDGIFCR